MWTRTIAMTGLIVVGISAATLLPGQISGQVRGTRTPAYQPPRMPDGRPDLQGVYDLATLTPLERPAGANATLTEEEAARQTRQSAAASRASLAPTIEREAQQTAACDFAVRSRSRMSSSHTA